MQFGRREGLLHHPADTRSTNRTERRKLFFNSDIILLASLNKPFIAVQMHDPLLVN